MVCDDAMWCQVSEQLPDLSDVLAWSTLPETGAVVTFSGVVRDHAPGIADVVAITYEAYEAEALRRLVEIADSARQSWPELRRVALLHRTGVVQLSQPSVYVVASSPHRGDAFAAARFCIDVLKLSVPIWKLEHTAGSEQWAGSAVDATPVSDAVRQWLAEHGETARDAATP